MPNRSYNIDIDSYIGYPISAAYVKSKLSPLKGRPVTVRINSYGGDVMTALDIRQQFRDHGDVTAYIVGMTASAATILAMGAKKVIMSRYALMLVHPASAGITEWGMYNHDQLEEAIKRLRHQQSTLDNIDSVIAAIYADHSAGRSDAKQMAEIMREARWLNADEALKAGLIDAIDEDESAPAPQPISDHQREIFAACGLPIPVAEGLSAMSQPSAKAEPSAPTDADADTDRTFFDRLRAFFASLIAQPVAEPQSTEAPTLDHTYNSSNTPTTTLTDMTKPTYPVLMAVLKDATTAFGADGSLTLDAAALQSLEKVLTDLQGSEATAKASLEEAQTALAKAETEIATLKAEDGAESAPTSPTAEDSSASIPGMEAASFFHKFRSVI